MKKRFLSMLLAAIMVLAIIPMSAITAFAADEVPVTGVNFTMSYAEIPTGKAMGFTAEVLPENATNKKITYTSSDYSVAVVDPSTGKITGVKAGTATITATSQDGNFTDTVEVKVIDGLGETNTVIFYGESITSPYETQTVGVGNKLRQPAVAPTKEGHVFCGWYTSWECVAPWDFDDTVGTGFYRIYAKFVAEADYVAVSGISLSTNSFTYDLKDNAIYPLTAKVAPENASVTPIIKWSISDPSVVEIKENSSNQIYFKGLKPGSATITATTKDGAYSASCVVTVTDSRSISLGSASSFDLAYVSGVTLSATIEPSDTMNKELVWTVDDPSILEIQVVDNDTIILNGLKEGVATVTVSTKDGMHTASREVTVTDSRFVFEMEGYLPGGNVSDILISSEDASSITQYKLYKGSTEVTGEIIDKTAHTLEIYFSCDSNILTDLTKEFIFLGKIKATDLVKSNSTDAVVTFELPALEYSIIEELDLYITPPIAEQTPKTTLTVSDPRVTVTVEWNNSGKFVEGQTYWLKLSLEVKPGYRFPDEIAIDVNTFKSQGKYKINGSSDYSELGYNYTMSESGVGILRNIYFLQKFTALPPHTHTYTNSVLQKNDTHHWLECDATDCPDKLGSIKDKVEHTFSTDFKTDADYHWKECSCGDKIEVTSHTFSTDFKTDAENHWKECACGAKTENGAHSGGTATCTAKAVCTTCNTAYGEIASHTHGTEFKNDATNHWNECVCGDKANVAPHADTNNDEKCDACSYAMPKAPSDNETEKPTEKPTDATDKPADATESKKDDETEAPADKGCGGCGSSAAISALAIVAVVGSALVIKKKED